MPQKSIDYFCDPQNKRHSRVHSSASFVVVARNPQLITTLRSNSFFEVTSIGRGLEVFEESI